MRYWLVEGKDIHVYYRGENEPTETRVRYGDGGWSNWRETDLRDLVVNVGLLKEVAPADYLMLVYSEIETP